MKSMADDDLTDAAKAEIAAAIRIVREDRFEQYARTAIEKHAPKNDPPTPPNPPVPPGPTPPIVPPGPTPPPPPPIVPPMPPEPPKKKSRLSYWGEQSDD